MFHFTDSSMSWSLVWVSLILPSTYACIKIIEVAFFIIRVILLLFTAYMMHDISFFSPIYQKIGVLNRVVDCGNSVMKDHCYWPLVSDLNNILSHRPVACKFNNNCLLFQVNKIEM